MFYFRLIVTALRSLDSHFLRSLLATVGVLIGVASVVASMAILEGASNKILNNFKSLGSNLLFISPEMAMVSGRPVGVHQTLLPEDMTLLERELGDDVDGMAPIATAPANIKYFQRNGDYSVLATSAEYFDLQDYNAQSGGRVFNRSESNEDTANVICLGSKVATELFGGMNPVGQTVKVRNVPFRVLGVMEQRGNIGFMNADETVYIPINVGLKRFLNRRWLNSITIQVAEEQDLEEVEKRVASVLRKSHKIHIGEKDDFRINNLEQALQQFNQFTTIFGSVFYSIAGISLVVGGIGIMNIMLVSVTERTREIGVRMAVGARRMDIMLQFLIEALIISLLGGSLGLLFGWMLSDLLENVLQGMMITEVTPTVVMAALVTSTLVGIVSGLYPAWQASRKNPVEALRYE